MTGTTHVLFSATGTCILLGTANPWVLIIGGLMGLLPDVDTSRSWSGQLLKPLSHYLEKRANHRGPTHSLLASLTIALLAFPVALINPQIYAAIVIGYTLGWFADCFTKTGVQGLWPSPIRLVCPGHPKYRLTTGSKAEYFLLAFLTIVLSLFIWVNSGSGFIQSLNWLLGSSFGAVEQYKQEGGQYLLTVEIKGRNVQTQQAVSGEFQVVQDLTNTSLIVRQGDSFFVAGSTGNLNIESSSMRVINRQPISFAVQKLDFQDKVISSVLSGLPMDSYLSGELLLDSEVESITTPVGELSTIAAQTFNRQTKLSLTSAPTKNVLALAGNSYGSGSLFMRHIKSVTPTTQGSRASTTAHLPEGYAAHS